jgi:hypothetical protein
MNYKNLKTLLDHILKKVKCPHCKKAYKDFGLNIVETFQDGCVVMAVCETCEDPSLIEVMILPEKTEIKESQIKIKTRQHRSISQNEVAGIHNFLKDFNGDFKKLFTNKK